MTQLSDHSQSMAHFQLSSAQTLFKNSLQPVLEELRSIGEGPKEYPLSHCLALTFCRIQQNLGSKLRCGLGSQHSPWRRCTNKAPRIASGTPSQIQFQGGYIQRASCLDDELHDILHVRLLGQNGFDILEEKELPRKHPLLDSRLLKRPGAHCNALNTKHCNEDRTGSASARHQTL